MSRSEASALGRLAAQGAGGFTDIIRETHRAIADRAFGTAPGGSGARVVHDGISKLVYAAVRAGLSGSAKAGGLLADARGMNVSASPKGRMLLGAVNGAWGDMLAEQHSPLAIQMHFPRLPEVETTATPRIAVFVHGLCETEEAWRLGSEECEPYAVRLRRDLGYTPLELRYNTGLHISDNGRRLAEILDHVCAAWPAGVSEIVFIGHSMGGLVARSACHWGHEQDMKWTRRVRHVFCLGSPLNGADLEKAANVAGWALGKLPETRALSAALNRRSAGIKDLRYGSLTDECWSDCDPDELLQDRRGEVPWLEGAQHTFIAASLFADPDHPLGRWTGDLLVRRPSAWGGGLHGEHEQFKVDASHCVGPANHFALLNHPDVYEQIEKQLRRDRGLPRRSSASASPSASSSAASP
jgi:pimeloyl-ACP methyl ester carboxylesterase